MTPSDLQPRLLLGAHGPGTMLCMAWMLATRYASRTSKSKDLGLTSKNFCHLLVRKDCSNRKPHLVTFQPPRRSRQVQGCIVTLATASGKPYERVAKRNVRFSTGMLTGVQTFSCPQSTAMLLHLPEIGSVDFAPFKQKKKPTRGSDIGKDECANTYQG